VNSKEIYYELHRHPKGSETYKRLIRQWNKTVDQEWANIEAITTETEQNMILSHGEQAAARIIERICKDMKHAMV